MTGASEVGLKLFTIVFNIQIRNCIQYGVIFVINNCLQ
jgi:hypothetical protein